MKSMQHHGTPLASFSGVGSVKFTDRDKTTDSKGYFEAAQFSSGRLVVSFVPVDQIGSSSTGSGDSFDDGISFTGVDVTGWHIEADKEVLYSRNQWLLASMTGHPYALSFNPVRLSVKRSRASNGRYRRTRFLISNFLWHGRFGDEPEPLVLRSSDFSAVVGPVNGYLDVAQRLKATQGIEPTASVSVEVVEDGSVSLDSFVEFVESTIYLLRLVTGNLVNWYSGDALDDLSGRVTESVYNSAVTAPYSNTVVFSSLKAGEQSLVPKVDLGGLSEAFFDSGDSILSRSTVRSLIDYFTNACNDRAYLEVRGLMASSLTELLVAKYAETKGFSEMVPEEKFMDEWHPVLESVIRNADLPEEFRQGFINHMRGAFRRPFRYRLKQLAVELGLSLNSEDRGRIVETRNSLVHRGTYRSSFEDGGWLRDYNFVTWVNFSILCRLNGYAGELPWYREGHALEI